LESREEAFWEGTLKIHKHTCGLLLTLLCAGCVSPTEKMIDSPGNESESQNRPPWHAPLHDAHLRVTKKSFGQYITPENSPVSDERFTGYHTGVDFEIFPEEEESNIVISALCSGPIVLREWISGYGGVVVQRCTHEEIGDVTILYGHLDIDSVDHTVDEMIYIEDLIGILGDGYSDQTDGERKHLHLGVHKGTDIEVKGYVRTIFERTQWVDPLELF
jgi:hypothetical protein